jgi:hypothetical protein
VSDSAEPLVHKLNGETAKIPWRELQRFFAQGKAVVVDGALDLLAVAEAVSADRAAEVEEWMRTGQLGQVSDQQALEWFQTDSLVWAVVVKPWVLVQAVRP